MNSFEVGIIFFSGRIKLDFPQSNERMRKLPKALLLVFNKSHIG
jgi:hypothetical protein